MILFSQYWRILTHYFCYSDPAELLLGTVITYGCFPEVERRLGTRKFLSLILRVWILHALLLALALSLSVTLSSTLTSISRWLQLPWVLSKGVASDGPIPIIVVVFLHHIRISPGTWTIQIGKALQTDENGLLALLLLVLAVSRRAAVLSCIISLLIAGACWPASGRRSSIRRLSSHSRNRGLGASSLDLSQKWLSTFARFLLRIPPFRIAVHMLLQLVHSAIGDTPKPPRSSRAERRRDPIIFPPENASARQARPQFSLRMPQLQLGRFNALMRQSNAPPTDAAEGEQAAAQSPVLPFFGPAFAQRRPNDEIQASEGALPEPSQRSEPPQSPSVQRPAFLANCEHAFCPRA
jgi:membrane associated rhomboid family serine protease